MTNKEIIEKKQEYINRLKAEKKELKGQNDFLRKQHREDQHKIQDQEKGLNELLQVERAIFKQICLEYGEKIEDGDLLVHRIVIDKPTLDGIKYMSYNKSDEKNKIIMGYFPPKKK